METSIQQQSEAREQRAKVILTKGSPETIDENTYLVASQYSDKKYKVTHIDSYSCECEDFKQRCLGKGLYCKHIKAIILFQQVKSAYGVHDEMKKEIEMIDTAESDCCPSCNSHNLIKRGIRQTTSGEKQRYSCKECKKRFVLSPIKNIKGNAKFVCLAMDCYYKGLSYRDISDQFKQFYGLDLHHETIRRWVLNFSKIMEKYSKTLTPKTSGVWNADETMIRTKKVKRIELNKDYPQHIKSLLRKKMIKPIGEFYIITDRGNSAITQQLRDGEYWVSPLKPKPFNPYPTARISKELRGYVK